MIAIADPCGCDPRFPEHLNTCLYDGNIPWAIQVTQAVQEAGVRAGKMGYGIPPIRVMVYMRDRWRCRYCGAECLYDATLDHVLPKSLGGRFDATNLVTACKACNQKKANRLPVDATYRSGSSWRVMELRPLTVKDIANIAMCPTCDEHLVEYSGRNSSGRECALRCQGCMEDVRFCTCIEVSEQEERIRSMLMDRPAKGIFHAAELRRQELMTHDVERRMLPPHPAMVRREGKGMKQW